MERWQNRVAVVTEASSSIGEACAKGLAEAGFRVVALARRAERLEENRSKLTVECQKRFFPRKCDITDEADVKRTFDWIEQTLGGTDVLINNAGIVREGNLLDMDMKLMDEVWHTNMRGLIFCTQAAFRSMKRRNFAGHLVHINSIAGKKLVQFEPGQGVFNIYSATKFALTAINEIVRVELNNCGLKIKTTCIYPGIVNTEMLRDDLRLKFGSTVLKPSDVCDTILLAISTPPNVLISELTVKPVGEEL